MPDTVQIPDDVMKLIASNVIEYSKIYSPKQVTIPAFHDGAIFGYSLSQQQLEELKKEISLLDAREVAWNNRMERYSEQLEEKDKEIEWVNKELNAHKAGIKNRDYQIEQLLGLRNKLQSFREKLKNITVDELLKNTGIVIELFDEHFKIEETIN